jgi:hypothetical protein
MALLISLATPASAVTVIGNVSGAPDPGLPIGFVPVINFDTPMAAGIVNIITGRNVVTAAGSSAGRAAPAGTPKGGIYQSIGPGGLSTFDFTGFVGRGQVLSGFSFYWGSVDSYNSIDFRRADGSLVHSFTGRNMPQWNGDQTAAITNRRLTFGLDVQDRIEKIGFRSSSPAFEFDSIGVTLGAVPEPANWALLIIGFGLTGAMLRWRRARLEIV